MKPPMRRGGAVRYPGCSSPRLGRGVPRSLSEQDRAILRATLASSGTAPGVFTNENVHGVLGAQGGKLCKEFRCDECGYAFAKST
jgi:hypothetical protein